MTSSVTKSPKLPRQLLQQRARRRRRRGQNRFAVPKQSTTSRHFILPHVDANIQLEPCQYTAGIGHRLSMEDKNDDGDDHTTKDNDDDDEHGNVTTSEGDDDDHDDDDDSEHNLQ